MKNHFTPLTYILLSGHLSKRRAQVHPCSAWGSPIPGLPHFSKDATDIRIVRCVCQLYKLEKNSE